MIFGLKIVYSAIGLGMFFSNFPLFMWFAFREGYFMDEFLRMSMLSFLCLGIAVGISFSMLYHEKFDPSLIRSRGMKLRGGKFK